MVATQLRLPGLARKPLMHAEARSPEVLHKCWHTRINLLPVSQQTEWVREASCFTEALFTGPL